LPLSRCGSACVDHQTSFFHCGGCNQACDAGQECSGGNCGCGGGRADCGGSCIDVQSDPANCGGCGMACAAGQRCEGGACQCADGGSVCGGRCVDTTADPANCGGCWRVCVPGQACIDGGCDCGSASVSFGGDVAPILARSCTAMGCHGAVAPKQGLVLTTSAAYGSLVDVTAAQCNDGRKRVAPGDPAGSYIIHKLVGANMCFGSQMPKAGFGLPDTDVALISNWICNGAPNN